MELKLQKSHKQQEKHNIVGTTDYVIKNKL